MLFFEIFKEFLLVQLKKWDCILFFGLMCVSSLSGIQKSRILTDKTSVIVTIAPGKNKRRVLFRYFLDSKGIKQLQNILQKRMNNALAEKNVKKAGILSRIRKELLTVTRKNYHRIIRAVYVAGSFTMWNKNKKALAVKTDKSYLYYETTKTWIFSVDKPVYKFVFLLALPDGNMKKKTQLIWINDPRCPRHRPDGFGGVLSSFVIKGFQY